MEAEGSGEEGAPDDRIPPAAVAAGEAVPGHPVNVEGEPEAVTELGELAEGESENDRTEQDRPAIGNRPQGDEQEAESEGAELVDPIVGWAAGVVGVEGPEAAGKGEESPEEDDQDHRLEKEAREGPPVAVESDEEGAEEGDGPELDSTGRASEAEAGEAGQGRVDPMAEGVDPALVLEGLIDPVLGDPPGAERQSGAGERAGMRRGGRHQEIMGDGVWEGNWQARRPPHWDEVFGKPNTCLSESCNFPGPWVNNLWWVVV